MDNVQIKRGDIYWVDSGKQTGSYEKLRPAIVVSNDRCNNNSPEIIVVYMTTASKKDLPTHTTIRSGTKVSTALCEQIHTVNINSIGQYMGTCTKAEMANVDMCLAISLQLSTEAPKAKEPAKKEEPKPAEQPDPKTDDKLLADLIKARAELAAATAQRDLLRELYDAAMERLAK